MRWLLRHRMWLAGVIVVLVLLAVALMPRPIEVELVTVTRHPMRVTIDDEGQTRLRDKFLLTAPVSGAVSRIELEPGDHVTRGQVLATMHAQPPPLLDSRTRAEGRARVDAARAALGQARAEEQRAAAMMTRARSELARIRPLAKAGAISDSDLEEYELRARTAEEVHRAAVQAVGVAANELEAARAALLESTPGGASGGRTLSLRAPVDGVVLRRMRESEAVVPAGEQLLEIGDPRNLEIVVDYLSADAVRIPNAAAAIVEQWGGGQPLLGRVRRIEPSGFTKISALGVEEQRVNVIVDFVEPVEAWKALGDGYRVEVRTVLWERDNVLALPVGSVFRQGETWAAFVAEEGRAQMRKITIGHRTDREVEVLGGVREGERVVIYPGDTLQPGSRIAPRNEPS